MDHTAATPDLYHLADSGHLDTISSEILAGLDWTEPDQNGSTPLHEAATYGHLHQVPLEVLTAGNLLVPNSGGQTPLHASALFGHLNQVPREALTAENLMLPDNHSQTPLMCAQFFNQQDQLLGVELSDACREIVGDKWWEKNQEFLARKARDHDSPDSATVAADVQIKLD